MTNENRPLIRTVPLTPEQQARRQEAVRRSELRQNFLVPIYLMWTRNVSQEAALHAQAGVLDTMMASGQDRNIAVIGSETLVPGEYENADWYVDAAYSRQSLRRDVGFGPQLDVEQFGSLFAGEPMQENPHWDILVVSNDLNARQNGQFINFVYGSTSPDFPYSVQSVRRIAGGTNNNDLNLAMIRNLLRHETGHMFGLVSTSRAVESLGGHCPNPCSMKQTLSIKELAENTITVENRAQHFCDDCMGDLAKSRDRFKPLPNSIV